MDLWKLLAVILCLVQVEYVGFIKSMVEFFLALFRAFYSIFAIILNAFAAIWPDAKFLFLITLCYSSIANAIASLIVLLYILNKHLKNSPLILSTVSVEPTLKAKLWSWFHYYWRFLLFSLGIAILLGGLLPLIAQWFDQDPISSLKYSKYIGNISMLPASWLAFWLLLRRKGKKQLLRISTCVWSSRWLLNCLIYHYIKYYFQERIVNDLA